MTGSSSMNFWRCLFALILAFCLFFTPREGVLAATGSPNDFVISVKTDNSGSSSNNQFTIPTYPGYIYNYNVDCNNDGFNEATGQKGNYTCTYGSTGTYTIRIKDNTETGAGWVGFPGIYFNFEGDSYKLMEIKQWGTGKWDSMYKAFQGCDYMTIRATDAPDLSNVTDMRFMFAYASAFNGSTLAWDTSNVTSMKGLFINTIAFNGNITGWNTSSVTDMGSMFQGASLFNQDIGGWNTSNVTNMDGMFYDASAFNQDLGGWNVTSLDDATEMFIGATLSTRNYDALLNGWDAQDLQYGVPFHGGNSTYCNGEAARTNMIAADNWSIPDGGKFCPPTNLQASDGTSTYKVGLSWTASTGATSYKVFRATSAGGTKTLLGTRLGLNNTTFADNTAIPGVTYYYWVKACQGSTCSAYSVRNAGWRKLSAPTNLQASDGTSTTKVQLTWTASTGATSYKVYRATSAGGAKTLLGSPTDTSFADSKAIPGVTYYYWVKAYRGTRFSAFSAYNTGWRKLSAPTNLQASDGTYTTKVQLTWNASAGATSYKVYRAISAGGAKTLLGTRTVTSFADTTATKGVTYYYWVKAYRGTRFSAFSATNTGWRK